MTDRRLTPAALAALLLLPAWPVAAQPLPGDVVEPAASDPAVLARLHARGDQVYVCKADAAGGGRAWSLREPDAVLADDAGRVVGRHSRGPAWRLDDGSAVTGKAVVSRAGDTPQDVAWLRLDVVERMGAGLISPARTVLRLHTRGGALSGACPTEGEVRNVSYTADYVFLR